MTGQLVTLAAWLGLSLGAGPAVAPQQVVPKGNPEAPWSRTPQAQQDKAMQLFEAANAALLSSQIKESVGLYQQAIQLWDHPVFHYNLAMALLALSSPLECHQQLDVALRYGPEPLNEPDKYKTALSIRAAMEEQLSKVELTCDQPEAEVVVDDRKGLFACPGSYWEWTQPGIHIIQVTKAGFRPTIKNLNLKAGEKLSIPLRVFTEAEWTHVRSRWPVWMPWTVIGGGAAAAALGGGLHVFARDRFLAYDKGVLDCAGGVLTSTFNSCPVLDRPELTGLLLQANVSQTLAWGLYLGGAAVMTTGAVLLSLNFPQPYLVDPDSGATIAIAPLLTPGSRGVVLAVGF